MPLALAISATIALQDAIIGNDVFVEDTPIPDPRDTGGERYLTLGVLSAPSGGWFGLRAQLDAWSIGGFSLGVAGTLFGRAEDVLGGETLKLSAVGFLAYTQRITSRFKLRAQLGWGGSMKWDADETTNMPVRTDEEIVEASLQLQIRANHDWAGVVGPILQYSRDAGDAMTDPSAVMMFAGVVRRF